MKSKLCVLLGIGVLTLFSVSCKSIQSAGGSGLSSIAFKIDGDQFPQKPKNVALAIWPVQDAQTGCESHNRPLSASHPLKENSVKDTLQVSQTESIEEQVEEGCTYNIEMMFWCSVEGHLEPCYQSKPQTFTAAPSEDKEDTVDVNLVFVDYKTKENVNTQVNGMVGPTEKVRAKINVNIKAVYQGENKISKVDQFFESSFLNNKGYSGERLVAISGNKVHPLVTDARYYLDMGWQYEGKIEGEKEDAVNTGLTSKDIVGQFAVTKVCVGNNCNAGLYSDVNANTVKISACPITMTKTKPANEKNIIRIGEKCDGKNYECGWPKGCICTATQRQQVTCPTQTEVDVTRCIPDVYIFKRQGT